MVTLKAGVAPHERRRKPNEPTQALTKFVQNDVLMKALIDFIHRAESLRTITFDNVKLGAEMSLHFGFALANTRSEIKVLTFQNCPLGSTGLRTLTPHISKLTTLNVLTLENCGLTDEAVAYLASIVRASESHMDQLYWNSTLRMDLDEDGNTTPGLDANDLGGVYFSGLVMLDVSRNMFTGASMPALARIVKSNHWLLGLNLRGNNIDDEGFQKLYVALEENNALETLLIGINPGFSKTLACKFRSLIKGAVTRLDSMPSDLFERFSKWNGIQAEEAEGRDGKKEIVVEPENKFAKKKTGKPVKKTNAAEAISASAAANGQQATPPRGPKVSRWNEGDDDADRTSPFRDYGMKNKDSLEYAIPTPVDDAFRELPSPQESPAVSLHSKGSGDFPLDGRPPSRNSLRPRSAQSQSYDVSARSQPVQKPMRVSLPTKWPGMPGKAKGKVAVTSSAGGISNSALLLGMSNGTTSKVEHVPFYPSGSTKSSRYADSRASNALASKRRVISTVSQEAPRSMEGAAQRRSTTSQGVKPAGKKRIAKKKRAASAGSVNNDISNRLDVLAYAVERVTSELHRTAEKLENVSDSLSETALNLSLTPMGQAAANSILALSQMDTSIGSIGADISRGSLQASPIRSGVRQSPQPTKQIKDTSSTSGKSKSQTTSADDLKALIKESIRKKLSEYAKSS